MADSPGSRHNPKTGSEAVSTFQASKQSLNSSSNDLFDLDGPSDIDCVLFEPDKIYNLKIKKNKDHYDLDILWLKICEKALYYVW